MSNDNPEPKTNIIAETADLLAWKAVEPDQEVTYHLELNNVTLHFFDEEWKQFLEMARLLVKQAG